MWLGVALGLNCGDCERVAQFFEEAWAEKQGSFPEATSGVCPVCPCENALGVKPGMFPEVMSGWGGSDVCESVARFFLRMLWRRSRGHHTADGSHGG